MGKSNKRSKVKTNNNGYDGAWRNKLHAITGLGQPRVSEEVTPMPSNQFQTVEIAEELECACKIIIVPSLTWFGRDSSYIVTQFGQSKQKFLRRGSI